MDGESLAVEAACQQFQFLVMTAVAAAVLKHVQNVRARNSASVSSTLQRPVVFVDHRRGRKIYHARQQFPRKNYKENHMWRMLENRDHHNVRTIDGRDFRKNYRVPATFFDDIVGWFRHHQWKSREHDQFLRQGVPLELKVLAVFTMLGRGVVAAVPAKEIGCDEKTIQEFFKFFCAVVAQNLYSQFICFPSTAAEVAACVATYLKENLPGCMGSIDCVHIPWIKCLASVRSWFTGKEGVPTVAFQVCCCNRAKYICSQLLQVIVDHNTRILSITNPHPGAHNDKTIASMDPLLTRIRTLSIFTTFAWTALSPSGAATFLGVYLICDGGYHSWRIMQRCNVITSCAKHLRLFSRIASARKDVECTFGRVKNRFRILKIPSLLQNLQDVSNVFVTCCIFHNMYGVYVCIFCAFI